ncbi:MAG TPA: lysophospholipid acyltransferase family protein, partial [Burkholderiales bacterium]
SHLVIGMAWVICGVRYRVIGRENLPRVSCIVLSKHQSAWETLAYQVLLPPQVWVLKRELLRVPFFGWGLAMMSPIAIDRSSASRALKQTLEQGRRRLADGWWIVIFPEGTRVAPGQRVRYQPGGAWLASKSGAPVVPIAHNAGTVWGRNAFIKYPGTITVSIGPTIDPSGMTPDAINRKAEDWIENEVARLGSAR